MGFGGLKKWAEGIKAQANPFDNGRTFNSVFNPPQDASQIPAGYNFDGSQPVSFPQPTGLQDVNGLPAQLPQGFNTENQNPLVMHRGELFPGQSFHYGYNDKPQQLPYIRYR